LAQLVGWCLDGNWPVSRVLMPFVASLGVRAAPEIQAVLNGNDGPGKYFILREIVEAMPREAIAALESSLRRIACEPSTEEIEEELPAIARKLLAQLRGPRL
jgi:hypothetical protein